MVPSGELSLSADALDLVACAAEQDVLYSGSVELSPEPPTRSDLLRSAIGYATLVNKRQLGGYEIISTAWRNTAVETPIEMPDNRPDMGPDCE